MVEQADGFVDDQEEHRQRHDPDDSRVPARHDAHVYQRNDVQQRRAQCPPDGRRDVLRRHDTHRGEQTASGKYLYFVDT